jgi:hypothetical protein
MYKGNWRDLDGNPIESREGADGLLETVTYTAVLLKMSENRLLMLAYDHKIRMYVNERGWKRFQRYDIRKYMEK